MLTDRVNSAMSLFQGRSDAYGIEKGGKVWAERQSLTIEQFQDHISGKIRLGIYPVNGTNSTHWAVIDFDTPDKARVDATYSKLVERGFFPYLEASRSKGFHIWIFFDGPIQTELARGTMSAILQEARTNGVEIFPKQDRLGDGELGNYVFLPLNGASLKKWKTAFLKLDFTPYEDQWGHFANIRRTPAAAVQSYISFINSFAFKGGMGGCRAAESDLTPPYNSLQFLTMGTRDNDLFHVANCMIKGGLEEDKAYKVLEIIAEKCDPPFPQKEVHEKIKSVLKRSERRERNLTEDLRQWISLTSAYFSLTEAYEPLQILTSQKNTAHQIMHRFVKEGFVERHPSRNGVYRMVETDCETIDFLHASDKTVDLRWPFGIERYFLTLPKNIIIIAGEPDAGKTAFLLNLIRINQARRKLHLFSSEMGSIELRGRLSKSDLPLDKWTFDAKERAGNFADVIHPDDINIIDFLEIHDEFYRVGGMIKEIFDKLKSGVAIIALQKNRGCDFGLGGQRGLEKARLYLAMEPGKIKIVKAKNWATETNPNGLCLDFKLVQGCKFIVERDWYRP